MLNKQLLSIDYTVVQMRVACTSAMYVIQELFFYSSGELDPRLPMSGSNKYPMYRFLKILLMFFDMTTLRWGMRRTS